MLAGTRHQHWGSPVRDQKLDCQRDRTMEYGQRPASSPKSNFSGFEVEAELVWNNWDLGREFTKTLIIKNTQSKLQRTLFRPPLSKYFTSLARQKIVVRPGSSFSVPITFKPLSRCNYEDTIEFQSRFGSFQVLLRAPAPCPALEVPESVQMPLCAVHHSTQTTFVLKNISKLTTFFHWEYSQPFTLSPNEGKLKPGQGLDISVAFHPQEAVVHQQSVSCRFGNQADGFERCCSLLLQGQAKHPYLDFKTHTNKKGLDHVPVLDFGGAAVGHTLHSHFEIYNPCPVPVCFTLSRLPGGIPLLGSVFRVDVTSAEVAPGGSLMATATFTPTTVDSTFVEYLSLLCKGAVNMRLLKLTGSGVGPQVSLSSSMVDFGLVEPGQAATQTVKLVNSSVVEALFQWDTDCSGLSVFSIQPAEGTIPRQSHISLTVVYKPTQNSIHYRRVACLILHMEPVFLNLVGNCPIEKPFQQLLESSKVHKHSFHIAATPNAEYFLSCPPCSPPLLSVTPKTLAFNQKVYSLPENLSSQKALTITSHSKVKLKLEWTAAAASSFCVSPLFCELPPCQSTSFRVTYHPKQLNSLHGAQLECFAFPMENNEGDRSVLPSCVTVRVVGHSYEPERKHSVPQCSLHPCLVEFPPVNIASHRSVLLMNTSDLPLTFDLSSEQDQALALAASLVVVPSCGLVPPQSHQILSLRTIPTEDSPEEGLTVQLHLNASKYTQKLGIISKSETPYVSLEADGKLHFQPTAVNSKTQRLHNVRNLSRQALRFEWRIPEAIQEFISVEPAAGLLHPNEHLPLKWSFSPLEERKYTLKPILTISSMQFPYNNHSLHLPLEVTGTGSVGYIQAKESVLEVKDVLIGACQTFSIPVVNNCPCAVRFAVTFEQKILDKDVNDPDTDQCALQVHTEEVTIVSKSTLFLQSTFTPHRKAQYMWTLSYQTINANGSLSTANFLCEVRAKGVFPTFQIVDVCGEGSLSHCSTKELWRLLSLKLLNESLQFSPCPTELTYSSPTRHSLYPTPAVFTKATVEFNFSAAPLHSDPSTFMLLLHNPGCIPVAWSFLFPQDQQLESEFWAMTGEFTSTELYQMKVQDNHLFSVSPRSGHLMPGQQRAVSLTYSHDFIAIDRFPVLLKISYGREIMLIFQGTTIEVDKPYLHYSSNTHVFTAVATGDYSPPKQMYQLYNQGAVPVKYEVDGAAFSKILEENFNHPVMRCLNPHGEIPPGEAAILEWVFSPLEAKLYQMDIPIHIQNGESTTVRFEGCGLTPELSNFSDGLDVPLVPCWQRSLFPERLAFLSEDSVDFGNLVVSSKSTRMLFLNNSRTDTVLFEWVLPQHNSQPQVMTIVPNRGRLFPGGTAHFVLTLFSSKYPTNYQFDAICKITCEAALCDYNNAVRHIEEEKERLKYEFIITDKIPKENKVVLTEKEAEAVALRQQAFLNKYKTLPPIRGTNDCNTVRSLSSKVSRAERRALRELSKVEKDPEPPKPCLLHLWVTGRSFSHKAFQKSLKQLDTQDRYRPSRYLVDDTHSLQEIRPLHKPESSDQLKEDAESEAGPGEGKPVQVEMSDLMEEVCLAALQDLMIEAIRGELDLTGSTLPTSASHVFPHLVQDIFPAVMPPVILTKENTTILDDDGTGRMDKDN